MELEIVFEEVIERKFINDILLLEMIFLIIVSTWFIMVRSKIEKFPVQGYKTHNKMKQPFLLFNITLFHFYRDALFFHSTKIMFRISS